MSRIEKEPIIFRTAGVNNLNDELKEKYGLDYEVQNLDPRIEEYLEPNQIREGKGKFEEDKRQMADLSSIDLSNKKNLYDEGSRERSRGYRPPRPYEAMEQERLIEDNNQNIDFQESQDSNFQHSRPFRRDRGYYIQKHLSPDGEVEHEEIVEPKSVYLRARDTQTPIREVINEGIQYNVEDSKRPTTTFKDRLNQRLSAEVGLSSQEGVPFSTIKKRDETDSDLDRRMIDDTPLKDLEEGQILALIRGNGQLQRMIIEDPMLRERLYEKFSGGMKHSSSDHTLNPNSFFSSKHIGDRRTQGETNIFRTPMRSLEEDKETNRFTQFANSEYIGKDGTIYDRASGHQVRKIDNYQEMHEETDLQEELESPENPSTLKKSLRSQRKKRDIQTEDRNFSFKDHPRSSKISSIKNNQDRISNTVELDENLNDLADEGEGNLDNEEDRIKESKAKSYTNEISQSDEETKKVTQRKSKIRDSIKRTSEYKRRYDDSGSQFDSVTGKKISSMKNKINLKHGGVSSKGSDQVDYSSQEEKVPSSTPSKKSGESRNVLQKYKSDQKGAKKSRQDMLVPKNKISGASMKKYLQKKSLKDDESGESYDEENRKTSESKAISYRDPKYSSKKARRGYIIEGPDKEKAYNYPFKKATGDDSSKGEEKSEESKDSGKKNSKGEPKLGKLSEAYQKIKAEKVKESTMSKGNLPKGLAPKKLEFNKSGTKMTPQVSKADLFNSGNAADALAHSQHESIEGSLKQGDRFSSKLGSPNKVYFSQQDHHENKEQQYDQEVKMDKELSDYPQSSQRLKARKNARNKQSKKLDQIRSYEPTDFASIEKGKKSTIKRKSSKYRETKDKLRSIKKEKLKKEEEDNKESESSYKEESSNNTFQVKNKYQSLKQEESENSNEEAFVKANLPKGFKALKSREYKGSKEQALKKETDKEKHHMEEREGDNQNIFNESEEIEGSIPEEHKYGSVLKSTKKSSKKADKTEEKRISKKYDLKKEIGKEDNSKQRKTKKKDLTIESETFSNEERMKIVPTKSYNISKTPSSSNMKGRGVSPKEEGKQSPLSGEKFNKSLKSTGKSDKMKSSGKKDKKQKTIKSVQNNSDSEKEKEKQRLTHESLKKILGKASEKSSEKSNMSEEGKSSKEDKSSQKSGKKKTKKKGKKKGDKAKQKSGKKSDKLKGKNLDENSKEESDEIFSKLNEEEKRNQEIREKAAESLQKRKKEKNLIGGEGYQSPIGANLDQEADNHFDDFEEMELQESPNKQHQDLHPNQDLSSRNHEEEKLIPTEGNDKLEGDVKDQTDNLRKDLNTPEDISQVMTQNYEFGGKQDSLSHEEDGQDTGKNSKKDTIKTGAKDGDQESPDFENEDSRFESSRAQRRSELAEEEEIKQGDNILEGIEDHKENKKDESLKEKTSNNPFLPEGNELIEDIDQKSPGQERVQMVVSAEKGFSTQKESDYVEGNKLIHHPTETIEEQKEGK